MQRAHAAHEFAKEAAKERAELKVLKANRGRAEGASGDGAAQPMETEEAPSSPSGAKGVAALLAAALPPSSPEKSQKAKCAAAEVAAETRGRNMAMFGLTSLWHNEQVDIAPIVEEDEDFLQIVQIPGVEVPDNGKLFVRSLAFCSGVPDNGKLFAVERPTVLVRLLLRFTRAQRVGVIHL